jgi:hypothetical protein
VDCALPPSYEGLAPFGCDGGREPDTTMIGISRLMSLPMPGNGTQRRSEYWNMSSSYIELHKETHMTYCSPDNTDIKRGRAGKLNGGREVGRARAYPPFF